MLQSMTEHIKKKLKDELAILEHELSHDIPKELKKAVAMGDLSENAEYHMAKQRQEFVRARLGQLKKRMGELSLINMSNIPRDRAGLTKVAVALIEPAGRRVAVDDLAPANAHAVSPAARAADDHARTNLEPRERRGKHRQREPVMPPEDGDAIDGQRADLAPVEIGKGSLGIEERGVQVGIGKCIQHREHDPLCPAALRQVVVHDRHCRRLRVAARADVV